MANTLKQGVQQLREIAGTAPRSPAPTEPATEAGVPAMRQPKDTVLIGAHFDRSVRRSLARLQSDPRNDGKKLNDLLAEALNDLFVKYGLPTTAMIGRQD
jgi:hypothetical protein